MALGQLLRAFLAPAPDPRAAASTAASSRPDALGIVRNAMESVVAARDQLAGRAGQLRERLEGLEAEAREALAGGGDDLARRILARRQIVASELELLQRQLRTANDEVARLALVEQQLTARADALATRERLLEARQDAATIRIRVGEALVGLSDEVDVGRDAPEDAERRAEELEARAAALDELLDAPVPGVFEIEP
jgi:phage shock protein A